MFCNRCGAPLGDEAKFCPKCGTRFEKTDVERGAGSVDELSGVRKAAGADTPSLEETEVLESAGVSAVGSSEAGEPASEKRFGGKVVGIGIAAVLVIVALVVAMIVLSMPPNLSDDQVLSDLNAESALSGGLTYSQWGANDGYQVVSQTVQSVDDVSYGDTKAREATVEVVFENASFKIVSVWMVDYVLQDKSWIQSGVFEYSRSTEPIGGVSDEQVINQVSSFMQRIDKDPPEDANGNKQYLEKLYSKGVDFSVLENTTSSSGGSVKVSLAATGGFAAYNGTLTVDFTWNGSDWEIADCSVDDGAYRADYSSMVGTWTGTFVKTEHNNVMDQAACYGGRTQPATLVIKSVSADALTAIVDISVLVHTHGSLKNPSETTDGDAYVTASDVLISIKPATNGSYQIYEGSDPSPFSVKIENSEDGSLSMIVYTSASFSDDHPAAWRTDYFDMVKS